MKKILLLSVILYASNVWAYDFEVDGIYYGLETSSMTAYVTGETWQGGGYSGDIVIPSKVTYNTKELDVTAIGYKAFYCCNISSITFPNSIVSIGNSAFQKCSINNLELPSNLKSIGESAFSGSKIESIIIPNSVTTIGKYVFSNCSVLENCILSNSIETISEGLFTGCDKLSNIDIPSRVRTIEYMAFRGCNSLTKLVIPQNVTGISSYAFYEVSSITEEIIEDSDEPLYIDVYNNDMRPISVYIGREVYGANILGWGYNGLKKLTLGSKISGQNLPISEGIEEIYSNIIAPKPRNKFWNSIYVNCRLYIPKGTLGKYQSTDGWKEFFQIIEDESLGEGTSNPQCAKPTISYSNGKLTFYSDTDGAICQCTITDSDIASFSSNEVQLGITYNISVYATKSGYENSEVATATLCWIDVDPKMEGIENSITQVRANAVLIQSMDGQIVLSGIDDGTRIYAYEVNGQQVGSAISHNGQANLTTNLKSGSIVIIKIGDRSVKATIK